jgi:hypothetical protein
MRPGRDSGLQRGHAVTRSSLSVLKNRAAADRNGSRRWPPPSSGPLGPGADRSVGVGWAVGHGGLDPLGASPQPPAAVRRLVLSRRVKSLGPGPGGNSYKGAASPHVTSRKSFHNLTGRPRAHVSHRRDTACAPVINPKSSANLLRCFALLLAAVERTPPNLPLLSFIFQCDRKRNLSPEKSQNLWM